LDEKFDVHDVNHDGIIDKQEILLDLNNNSPEDLSYYGVISFGCNSFLKKGKLI